MNKLLIIGASIGQLPLLKKAKERGIHVTVASIPGNYCCFEFADDIIYKDIYDREGIVEEAKRRRITAVISDQNDLMMPTVAYVAEKLGLPGNRFDTVMSYCDKNKFRSVCDKVGVPCPKHIAVHSVDDDLSVFDAPLPWIVKPADSQSSIGISRIDKQEYLMQALELALDKSPTHSAIIEEFFEGQELVCEGFIDNGKYYNLQFGDRRYFRLDNCPIPSQTLFPSVVDEQVLRKIQDYEQALASYTCPSFAIVHSEYLYNSESGEIRIVESALRGGGVYISSHLVPLSTGIDINDVLLDKALGKNVNTELLFKNKMNNAAGYVCFYLEPGVVSSVEGADIIGLRSDIALADINNIQPGFVAKKMEYKGMRLGPFIVKGKDRYEIESTIKWLQHNYCVKMVGNTINAVIWD